MSGRISHERLLQLKYQFDCGNNSFDRDTAQCFAELQQSRALVTELRALAVREYQPDYKLATHRYIAKGAVSAFQSELDSLLAAHDAQQADQPNG